MKYFTIRCICFLLLSIPLFSIAQVISRNKDASSKNIVLDEKYLMINGIEQWVTIKGVRSKPVILFLHGGPGSPISPYSDSLYKNWQKDFIIVQWDQRGTGKTFGRYAPEELTPEYLQANPLSVEQMTLDGIELSKYLIKYLNKKKLILFGTSWGSVLGVKMASKRPDLYYAYVGHSQIVNPSSHLAVYQKVYQMSKDNNDESSLKVLNTIGMPPYDNAKNVGQLFRIIKKYERQNSTPAPENWFEVSPKYDNAKDNQDRENGDDYSFVNFTGDHKLGVPSMSASIDFTKTNLTFNIPIYLIQGEEDLLTPKESSKAYFDKIKAPKKKYYLLSKTAHGFNEAVLETHLNVVKEIAGSNK